MLSNNTILLMPQLFQTIKMLMVPVPILEKVLDTFSILVMAVDKPGGTSALLRIYSIMSLPSRLHEISRDILVRRQSKSTYGNYFNKPALPIE